MVMMMIMLDAGPEREVKWYKNIFLTENLLVAVFMFLVPLLPPHPHRIVVVWCTLYNFCTKNAQNVFCFTLGNYSHKERAYNGALIVAAPLQLLIWIQWNIKEKNKNVSSRSKWKKRTACLLGSYYLFSCMLS